MTDTALAPAGSSELAPKGRAGAAVADSSPFANLLDTAKFDHLWRVAQMYADTQFVPAVYQKKPSDCFVALQMALRLGIDPMMFMQKTYVIQGKPGMEAQLCIALINSNGPFKGPIQYKLTGEGMDRACTAFAVHKVTNELCECEVSMKVAEKEGWLNKSGSKWKTMPDQMLRYRAATWFGRIYCPECLMGMTTTEEIDDGAVVIETPNLASLPTGRTAFRPESAKGAEPEAPKKQKRETVEQPTAKVNDDAEAEAAEAALRQDKDDADPPKPAKEKPAAKPAKPEKTTRTIDEQVALLNKAGSMKLAVMIDSCRETTNCDEDQAVKAIAAWLGSIGLEIDNLTEPTHREAVQSQLATVPWSQYVK